MICFGKIQEKSYREVASTTPPLYARALSDKLSYWKSRSKKQIDILLAERSVQQEAQQEVSSTAMQRGAIFSVCTGVFWELACYIT